MHAPEDTSTHETPGFDPRTCVQTQRGNEKKGGNTAVPAAKKGEKEISKEVADAANDECNGDETETDDETARHNGKQSDASPEGAEVR